MIDYEWLMPVLRTWMHLICGASVISDLIVVGLVFGRWAASVLDQIENRRWPR